MNKAAIPGSIFSFEESHYVFLAYNPQTDRIYAARILDDGLTSEILAKKRSYEKAPIYDPSKEAIFCFVILTTDDFEGRAAFYGRMDAQNPVIETIFGQINEDDFELLKSEILASGVNPDIKKRIQEFA